MEKPVYPCNGCKPPRCYRCKQRCEKWQRWYCYRQSLINEYARKLQTHWLYRLPLHRAQNMNNKEIK